MLPTRKRLRIAALAILLLLLFTPLQKTHAKWDKDDDGFFLSMNGKVVLKQNDDTVRFPSDFPLEEQIDFALQTGELFILNDEDGKLAQLLDHLDRPGSEYELAKQLLLALRSKQAGDDPIRNLSELSSFSKTSSDPNLRAIAQNTYRILKGQTPIRSVCRRGDSFYSLCRTFRVQYFLTEFSEKDGNNKREYLNLIRVAAPFLEEAELNYVPFLADFAPALSEKLSALGLAKEAVHFQKMEIVPENLSGQMIPESYEKLAFEYLQMQDYTSAEKVYSYLEKYGRELSPTYRNKLHLQMGTAAYLDKRYDHAKAHYLNLDFNHWGTEIKNPFLDEPISINGTRDLVSLPIWKTNGPHRAVKALHQMSHPRTPTEDDLMTRLRIVQILFKDKPETAEKMSEEISYMAQSKGWRRAEYSATLLHGLLLLQQNNFRKGIIEFTKAYSILQEADREYASEWTRLFGMFMGRETANQNRNAENVLDSLEKMYFFQHPNDVSLEILHYLPSDYLTGRFLTEALSFYQSRNDYDSMLKLCLLADAQSRLWETEFREGFYRIAIAEWQSKQLLGFVPSWENSDQTISFEKIRKEATKSIIESFHPDPDAKWQNTRIPVVGVFSIQGKTYLFDKKPGDKLQLTVFGTDKIQSYLVQKTVNEALEKYRGNLVQIYMNREGLELEQEYGNRAGIYGQFFYKWESQAGFTKPKAIAVLACDGSKISNPVAKGLGPLEYDGRSVWSAGNFLQIWDQNAQQSGTKGISGTSWQCGKDIIHFIRLQRRIDSRNLPGGILFSGSSIADKNSDHTNLLEWIYFWMEKGVPAIYYTENAGGWRNATSDQTDNLLNDPTQYLGKSGFTVTAGIQ